jgi:hypothetical protein
VSALEPHASPLVFFGIAVIACALAVVGASAYAYAGKARGEPGSVRARRFVIALVVLSAWLTATALVARSGVLTDFTRRPPPLMFIILATVAGGLSVGLSPIGARLAAGLPFAAVIGIQSFRFPLELVMHQAAREGVMPVQMSFSGWNFDIVAGLSAIVVAALAAKGRAPRALLVAWNLLGAALLINVAVIGVTSLPMIAAFGSSPDRLNTWLAFFPFVWLPTVMVSTAMAGHLVVARKLASARAADRAAARAAVSR